MLRWFVPETPDFYELLVEICANVAEGTAALVDFMKTNDDATAERVVAIERAGDRLKRRCLDTLHRSFATPIDREDIFSAVNNLDTVLNYAKSTVSEMHALLLPPDEHTLAMAELLDKGANALLDGFRELASEPAQAERHAEHARKSERDTEKVYRAALAELFDAEHYLANLTEAHRDEAAALEVLLTKLDEQERRDVTSSVAFVVEIMKRREIYRHMSNAADRVAIAAETLHDIIVKVT
ncbi:MAG: DUF47 family protein [Pseudomonadales bacterium]|nr:DUF47 family protein [Pseudomonadales bacterium]